MLIADTSALLAIYGRTDNNRPAVERYLRSVRSEIAVSPYVVAELDYLVTTRVSAAASRLALGNLLTAPFQLAEFGRDDVRAALDVLDRYADQAIGITDASLVVLAERLATRDILTLDHRHFDVLRPADGGRFRLMPRDWDGA